MAALCSVAFCLLAGLATLLFLPVMLLVPGKRPQRVRRFASFGFRLLLHAVEVLGLGHFRIEGREWIGAAHGRLLVANHPGFLDVVALLAILPDANSVVKNALRRHPLFGPFVCAGGYLGNASDPQRTIAACREAGRRGETIIIFPEGTRTQPGAPAHFHRGAAQIAIRAGMEILPVTIRCSPPVLTHGHPWFRMPARRFRYVICFHKPCRPEAFAPLDGLAPPLAARRLTRGLEEYFRHTLSASDHAQTAPAPIPDSAAAAD